MKVRDDRLGDVEEHLLIPGDCITFEGHTPSSPTEDYRVIKPFNFMGELDKSGITVARAAEGILTFDEQAGVCHHLMSQGFIEPLAGSGSA